MVDLSTFKHPDEARLISDMLDGTVGKTMIAAANSPRARAMADLAAGPSAAMTAAQSQQLRRVRDFLAVEQAAPVGERFDAVPDDLDEDEA